jgi:hypothetical protein
MGHADLSLRFFFNETHALQSMFVAGVTSSHVVEKAAIDLVDNFEVSRQEPLE